MASNLKYTQFVIIFILSTFYYANSITIYYTITFLNMKVITRTDDSCTISITAAKVHLKYHLINILRQCNAEILVMIN